RRSQDEDRFLRGPGSEVLEPGEFANEGDLHDACRTVALLADNEFGDALRINRRVLVSILLFAVDENHDIRVLFKGTRFPEVGELRPMVGARFRRTTELREYDDRDVQLFRQPLE